MVKINFTSDGFKLAGNLFQAAQPGKLAFLFIQGWTGHQNVGAAQKLADLGFTSLTYDMRGNRDSEGDIAKFARADFARDTCVAYDFLKQQLPPGTNIGVVGSSFGAYTAALLSQERKVYCLSFRVPASYPDEGFDQPQLAQKMDSEDFRQWRKKRLSYSENRAFQALHGFTGPVQIIEAGADELVPSEAAQNYAAAVADAAKLTHDIMKGAPHNITNAQLQAEYEQLLIAWVRSISV